MNDASHPSRDLAAQVRYLAEKVCNETITPEECHRLNDLLRDHPEAQSVYLACMSIHARLSWEFGPAGEDETQPVCVFADGESVTEPSQPCLVLPARRGTGTTWRVFGALAAAALVVICFWLTNRHWDPGHQEISPVCLRP